MSTENEFKNHNLIEAGSRFLSFTLGEEEFAIPLLTVKEVIGMPDITPIPYTPNYFLGIMNLRGQVISIMDLRQKLNVKSKNTEETAVIICSFGTVNLGVVVDSVNSVLNPRVEDVSPKPEIQSSKSSDYIQCVYRKDKKLVLFLDISKALSVEDYAAINKAAPKKAA